MFVSQNNNKQISKWWACDNEANKMFYCEMFVNLSILMVHLKKDCILK